MEDVDAFLQYIRYELNYSEHTVSAYAGDLRQFFDFIGRDQALLVSKAVTAKDVRAWVFSMSKKGISARTIRRKVQAIRTFYKYLLKKGMSGQSPVDDIPVAKIPVSLPAFVRERGMERVLEDDGYDRNDFAEVRDRLIVDMLYETGIRRAELISLKNADVDTVSCELKVHGKRNKDRIVPFGEKLKELIEDYRCLRSEIAFGGIPNLFLTEKGEPVYPSLVYRVVTRALSEVAKGKRSPHTLRHSFASAMLNNGADLNSVKELLGHESLAATQIYTHISYSELKKNYKHAHPRALKKGG